MSQPMIESDTSLEVWELTLPEEEAGCNTPYGCDRAAVWVARGRCGHHLGMLCDFHRRQEDELTNRVPVDALVCNQCNRPTMPITWVAL
jgi:hypothetical protein